MFLDSFHYHFNDSTLVLTDGNPLNTQARIGQVRAISNAARNNHMSKFQQYRRKQIEELRPFAEGAIIDNFEPV